MSTVDLDLFGIGIKYDPNDGWQGFRDFLVNNHAILFPPLNLNEIYRVSTRIGSIVGQKDKKGKPFHHPRALKLIDIYEKKLSPPSLSPIVTRRAPYNSSALTIATLITRDGPNCFYCGREVRHPAIQAPDLPPATCDHFIPRAKGGPNNIHNYVLACESCNRKVGSVSIVEKVKFREQKMKIKGTVKTTTDDGLLDE